MKYIVMALTFFVCSFTLWSQDDTDVKPKFGSVQEVGFVFSSFDNFGLSYRIGNQKGVMRFNTLLLDFNHTKREDDMGELEFEQKTRGAGLSVGYEWRTTIVKNLAIRYGLDVGYRYGFLEIYDETFGPGIFPYYRRETTITHSFVPNAVLGFNYVVANQLVLGFEWLPAYQFSNASTTSQVELNGEVQGDPIIQDTQSHSFSSNQNNIRLSVLYRF